MNYRYFSLFVILLMVEFFAYAKFSLTYSLTYQFLFLWLLDFIIRKAFTTLRGFFFFQFPMCSFKVFMVSFFTSESLICLEFSLMKDEI